MFLFDKFRSSRQKYSTGNKCELRWKTFLPANPPFCAESTAIVDSDGNFYFGSHSGVFYSLNKNGESDIWQRRYWEHTIMSEEDLYRHIDYIHYNSMKHYNIAPRDWSFSSFNRFVKNND